MSAKAAFTFINSLDIELRRKYFPTGPLLETCFLELSSWNHLLGELYYSSNREQIESQLEILLAGLSIRIRSSISQDSLLNNLLDCINNRSLPSPFLFYSPTLKWNFISFTLKLKAIVLRDWCREFIDDPTYISVWDYWNSLDCFQYDGSWADIIDLNATLGTDFDLGDEPTEPTTIPEVEDLESESSEIEEVDKIASEVERGRAMSLPEFLDEFRDDLGAPESDADLNREISFLPDGPGRWVKNTAGILSSIKSCSNISARHGLVILRLIYGSLHWHLAQLDLKDLSSSELSQRFTVCNDQCDGAFSGSTLLSIQSDFVFDEEIQDHTAKACDEMFPIYDSEQFTALCGLLQANQMIPLGEALMQAKFSDIEPILGAIEARMDILCHYVGESSKHWIGCIRRCEFWSFNERPIDRWLRE